MVGILKSFNTVINNVEYIAVKFKSLHSAEIF